MVQRFQIPNYSMDDFRKKFAQFKRKFDRYGEDLLTCEVSEPYICDDKNSELFGYEVCDVDIDASYKITGDNGVAYQLIASLDYDKDLGKNIIYKNPQADVEVPKEYYTRCECDHCHQNRDRIHTVLLRNPDSGEYVQVGKTCLKDYLGVDFSNYAAYLSIIDSVEDSVDDMVGVFLGLGRRLDGYPKDDLIYQAFEEIKAHGYHNSESDVPTSWVVRDILSGRRGAQPYTVSEQTKEQAEEAFKMIEESEETGDFMHNMKTIVQMDIIPFRSSGIACYIPQWYFKQKDLIKKRQVEKEQGEKSEYVGNVGDRITFTGKPTAVYSFDTQYGVSVIYKFVDEDNHIFIWTTSTYLNPDKTYTITATIKEHKEFRGDKQTVVTRGKIQQVEDLNEDINSSTLKSLEKCLSGISGFRHDDPMIANIIKDIEGDTGLDVTIEKIDGWYENKNCNGEYLKDYTCSAVIGNRKYKFLIEFYADQGEWVVKEILAYVTGWEKV